MSVKRKANDLDFERRLRARRDSSTEEELILSGPESTVAENLEYDENSSEQSEGDEAVASISFGALMKAQATLTTTPAQRHLPRDDMAEEKDEKKGSRKEARTIKQRQSKHAPMEISSKRAVTRKREVISLVKRVARDPRFESGKAPIDEAKVRKDYAFLDGYREDEMKELKANIKSTKDEEMKEKLKRTLLSMESKKKTQLKKLKELEILDRHRKQEKELVKQGKQPFYLKKAEQKNQVLLDQYKDLKGKQLDHVIERRRKKIDGKEKKKMPFARRKFE